MSVDQRGDRVLESSECHTLLAHVSPHVGRVVVNADSSPHVIPVDFSLSDGSIFIRLGAGWTAFHLDNVACTFEVDQVGPSGHTGWSIVVEGTARIVPYDEVGRLGGNLPRPHVPRPGVRVFEIVPSRVTGRALDNEF